MHLILGDWSHLRPEQPLCQALQASASQYSASSPRTSPASTSQSERSRLIPGLKDSTVFRKLKGAAAARLLHMIHVLVYTDVVFRQLLVHLLVRSKPFTVRRWDLAIDTQKLLVVMLALCWHFAGSVVFAICCLSSLLAEQLLQQVLILSTEPVAA